MADWFYGVNRGQGVRPQDVTVGTSTGATDVELRVAQGASLTKKDVTNILKTIENFILSNGVGTTTGPGVDLPKI